MRFDKAIYFQKTSETYDETTGDYIENEPFEELRYADITDAGVNTLQIIYGSIKEAGVVIRLQQPYSKPFDYIRIENKRFKVGFSRSNKVFVAREVQ